MQPCRHQRAGIPSPGFLQEDRSLWVPTTNQPTTTTKSHRRIQEFATCVRCHLRFGNDLSITDCPNCLLPPTTPIHRSAHCLAPNFPLFAPRDSGVGEQIKPTRKRGQE